MAKYVHLTISLTAEVTGPDAWRWPGRSAVPRVGVWSGRFPGSGGAWLGRSAHGQQYLPEGPVEDG
jgi:hypothetical protein